VSIAFGGVQDEIADARARNVEVLGRDIGEMDSRRDIFPGPKFGCCFEMLLAEIRET